MKKGRPGDGRLGHRPRGPPRRGRTRPLRRKHDPRRARDPCQPDRAPRRFETVATRWGDVRLKLRGWEGRVIGAMPEYDDCLRLSRASGAPIREIWAEANRLGEVFAGQRWAGPSLARRTRPFRQRNRIQAMTIGKTANSRSGTGRR